MKQREREVTPLILTAFVFLLALSQLTLSQQTVTSATLSVDGAQIYYWTITPDLAKRASPEKP